MKNITFSADESLIRKARAKAFKNNTTLNVEFRKWLEKFTEDNSRAETYRAIMKKLNYVSLKRKPSREEMNER